MPESLDLRRLVWPPTALALALAFACACSDEAPTGGSAGDDDSASEDDDSPSDEDDDSTSEEDPRDAKVPAKDSGSDGGSSRDSGGSGAQDAALRDAAPPPARDAGGGIMDGGPIMVPVGDGSVSGIPEAELAMLRQVCVDEINRYRATLMLAPIQKASAQQEQCSDLGAKKDGDSRQAHSSAGGGNPCVAMGIRPNFRSQNTCPGYPVRRGGTIADSLKMCLKQMWDEGEPPQGEAQCLAEYRMGNTACFLAHGHWINMKGNSRGVSCGFYKMANGSYWMNQDFY